MTAAAILGAVGFGGPRIVETLLRDSGNKIRGVFSSSSQIFIKVFQKSMFTSVSVRLRSNIKWRYGICNDVSEGRERISHMHELSVFVTELFAIWTFRP